MPAVSLQLDSLDAKTTVSVKFDGAVQDCAVSLASTEAFLEDLRTQLKLSVHTQLTVLEWDKGSDDFVVLTNPSALKEGAVLKVKVKKKKASSVGGRRFAGDIAGGHAAPIPSLRRVPMLDIVEALMRSGLEDHDGMAEYSIEIGEKFVREHPEWL